MLLHSLWSFHLYLLERWVESSVPLTMYQGRIKTRVGAKSNLLRFNSETSMKESFYPNVKKKNLLFTFRHGKADHWHYSWGVLKPGMFNTYYSTLHNSKLAEVLCSYVQCPYWRGNKNPLTCNFVWWSEKSCRSSSLSIFTSIKALWINLAYHND